jgi:hypothetical protein
MKKLEPEVMEKTVGGDWRCDYTVNGLFAFGGAALTIPGLQVVGGVTLVLALGLQAGGGCGSGY